MKPWPVLMPCSGPIKGPASVWLNKQTIEILSAPCDPFGIDALVGPKDYRRVVRCLVAGTRSR